MQRLVLVDNISRIFAEDVILDPNRFSVVLHMKREINCMP